MCQVILRNVTSIIDKLFAFFKVPQLILLKTLQIHLNIPSFDFPGMFVLCKKNLLGLQFTTCFERPNNTAKYSWEAHLMSRLQRKFLRKLGIFFCKKTEKSYSGSLAYVYEVVH